jgi:hypothetical protein
MLAGVATWGDPEKTWLELGPVVTPALATQSSVAVNYVAPNKPGRYRIFVVMAAESDAAHIASGTNWTAGAPRWHDDNDLALWGDTEATSAHERGKVAIRARAWVYGAGHGSPGAFDLASGVIEVIVRDTAATRATMPAK